MNSANEQTNVTTINYNDANRVIESSLTDFPTGENVAANIASQLDDLAKNGEVNYATVLENFPGFVNIPQQASIKDNGEMLVYTNSPWQQQNDLKFQISPIGDNQIIPSTAELIIDLKFVKNNDSKIGEFNYNTSKAKAGADGTTVKMPNAVPVNNFFGHLFKQMQVKKNNVLITKAQEYMTYESNRELSRINHSRLNIVACDLLYSPIQTTPNEVERKSTVYDSTALPKFDYRVNDNIIERIRWCNKEFTEGESNRYKVPLSFFNKFFKTFELLPEGYEFDLEINLESDMKVLF